MTLPPGFQLVEQAPAGLPAGFQVQPAVRSREEIFAEIRGLQAQAPTKESVARIKSLLDEVEQSRLADIAALPPAQRALVEDISPGRAALIAAGGGLTDIGRAVGLVDPASPIEREARAALEQARPEATAIGEVVGQTAPFLPAGLAAGAIRSTAPRVLATGALGATEGALIARGAERDVGEQLLSAGIGGTVAGAVELGLPIIGRLGGKIIRRMTGKAPAGAVIDAAGRPSQELLESLERSGQSFDDLVDSARREIQGEALEPDQAARAAFLRSQGLEPTRAQVTRNAAEFQAQQEAAKTEGRVRRALERQDAILTTRFDNAILETGGRSSTPTSTVADALTEKATRLDQEISDLYRVARETAQGDKVVRFNALSSRLRTLAPDNEATGGAIRSIAGNLQNRGVLDRDLNVVGRIDVNTAEEVRKQINELFDPAQPFRNATLRKLKDALDDDVFRTAGGDVFSRARGAKRNFEQELTRARVSKFDSRKDNLVRDVLENKIDPDQMVNKVIFSKRWRPDDVEQLRDYISTSEAGREAFNDLRAETLQQIKERAFIGAADEQGFQTLSRDKLQKSLQSIGQKKLAVLFTPDEQRFLKDMLDVARIREPVRATAIGRGPSAQAIARLERKISDLPVMGSLVSLFDIDAQGRFLIKGTPERVATRTAPSPVRSAAALSAAALPVAAQEE